ncbi:MAG: HAD-superfamily hydrolase [Bacillales bacterium]|nr:HAD-superfamily hydrolase [Bacillales bacterium]
MTETKVVFFDLFHTLITPDYLNGRNENDVLSLTVGEWEEIVEDCELYLERASGLENNPIKMMEKALLKSRKTYAADQLEEIADLRLKRMQRAISEVPEEILHTLRTLKEKGLKLCLISNADYIDVAHWENSTLANLFDDAIFSYKVGLLKPNKEIYLLGLSKMIAKPEECYFVGDGGSEELRGAKEVGISTIMVEHFRMNWKRECVVKHADYVTNDFSRILNIIN